MPMTSAAVMARSVGIDLKAFRMALKRQKFAWHAPQTGWGVEVDSPEHGQMIAVLREMFISEIKASKKRAPKKAAKAETKSDADAAPKAPAKKAVRKRAPAKKAPSII